MMEESTGDAGQECRQDETGEAPDHGDENKENREQQMVVEGEVGYTLSCQRITTVECRDSIADIEDTAYKIVKREDPKPPGSVIPEAASDIVGSRSGKGHRPDRDNLTGDRPVLSLIHI